ncbi:MAG: 50S ribosomal protein L22 [Planctomycetota bacterium]
MAFKSTFRYARISPRKVRPLADLVRGKFVDEALDILRYQPQRGARMLESVIKTALANAQDPEQNPGRIVDENNLLITDARIDGGPMFKRVRPGGRGMSFLIKKRMSHISVEIDEI